jgi:hypothetical protein
MGAKKGNTNALKHGLSARHIHPGNGSGLRPAPPQPGRSALRMDEQAQGSPLSRAAARSLPEGYPACTPQGRLHPAGAPAPRRGACTPQGRLHPAGAPAPRRGACTPQGRGQIAYFNLGRGRADKWQRSRIRISRFSWMALVGQDIRSSVVPRNEYRSSNPQSLIT